MARDEETALSDLLQVVSSGSPEWARASERAGSGRARRSAARRPRRHGARRILSTSWGVVFNGGPTPRERL